MGGAQFVFACYVYFLLGGLNVDVCGVFFGVMWGVEVLLEDFMMWIKWIFFRMRNEFEVLEFFRISCD